MTLTSWLPVMIGSSKDRGTTLKGSFRWCWNRSLVMTRIAVSDGFSELETRSSSCVMLRHTLLHFSQSSWSIHGTENSLCHGFPGFIQSLFFFLCLSGDPTLCHFGHEITELYDRAREFLALKSPYLWSTTGGASWAFERNAEWPKRLDWVWSSNERCGHVGVVGEFCSFSRSAQEPASHCDCHQNCDQLYEWIVVGIDSFRAKDENNYRPKFLSLKDWMVFFGCAENCLTTIEWLLDSQHECKKK